MIEVSFKPASLWDMNNAKPRSQPKTTEANALPLEIFIQEQRVNPSRMCERLKPFFKIIHSNKNTGNHRQSMMFNDSLHSKAVSRMIITKAIVDDWLPGGFRRGISRPLFSVFIDFKFQHGIS